MQSKWFDHKFKYDGTQLRSLFAYLDHKVLGDSVVSWVGPCEVTFEHMVDGEDLNAKAQICGDLMVHFIVEKFDCDLSFGVAMQRFLATHTIGALKEISKDQALVNTLFSDGDDVYSGEKKMSISVATRSPISTLVHFAVNVINQGTPVKTLCLNDFNVDPMLFSKCVMEKLVKELASIKEATQKVKWVK